MSQRRAESQCFFGVIPPLYPKRGILGDSMRPDCSSSCGIGEALSLKKFARPTLDGRWAAVEDDENWPMLPVR